MLLLVPLWVRGLMVTLEGFEFRDRSPNHIVCCVLCQNTDDGRHWTIVWTIAYS